MDRSEGPTELETFEQLVDSIIQSKRFLTMGWNGLPVVPGLSTETVDGLYIRLHSMTSDPTARSLRPSTVTPRPPHDADQDGSVSEEDGNLTVYGDGDGDGIPTDDNGRLYPPHGAVLILKDPDHEDLAFMIFLGRSVLRLGDEEIPTCIRTRHQVVVELSSGDDLRLLVRAVESLRRGMETDLRVGALLLRGMSGGLVDNRPEVVEAEDLDRVGDALDPVRSTVFEVLEAHLIESTGDADVFHLCW